MRTVRYLPATIVAMLLIGATVVPSTVLADPPAPTPAPPADAGPVERSAAVHSDVSPPLRNLVPTSPSAATRRKTPLRLISPGGGAGQPDGALQATTGPLAGTTSGLGFAGVGQGDYGYTDQFAPPDTNGAVGATQYVQWVNAHFAVFDKSTGAIAAGFPKAGNAPWVGFGGACQTNNDGDPIAQYDKIANRWILTQFSVSTKPYLQCVAVSTSPDATGSYNRYAFSYGNTQFPDYPKLSVWPDGYYISYNIFNRGQTWAGSKVCAFDRVKMLAGQSATQQCFQLSTSYPSLLPADLDGASSTLGNPGSTSSDGLPPAGSPNFLVNFGTNALNLWKFHVNWSNSADTTLTGPTSIPVADFTTACSGGGTCIPQPDTSQKLGSLGDRLMYRLAYRHFADGREALVVNHSVSVSGVTSVRWYELRNPTDITTMADGAPVVSQQGTLNANDAIHRWMGSIAMDRQGNMALGYSVSSGSLFPSIRYTGRLATDAAGTMQAETEIKSGTGSQLATLSRWGDYSAMTVDPVDDCTFWYTNEYLKSSGTFNWSTWIASFRFPGCTSGPAVSVSVASDKPIYTTDDTIAILTAVVTDEAAAPIVVLSSAAFATSLDGSAPSTVLVEFVETSAGIYQGNLDIVGLSEGSHSVSVTVTDSREVSGTGIAAFSVRTPTHNVAVTAVTPAVATAKPGDAVAVVVDVRNLGDYAETFVVQLDQSPGGLTVGSESVILAAGASDTVSFAWTAPAVVGDYTLTAVALVSDAVPGDDAKAAVVTVASTVTKVYAIAAGPDDVNSGCGFEANANEIAFGKDQLCKPNPSYVAGLRFTGVDIPADSTVQSAFLTVVPASNYSILIGGTFAAEASPDPAAWSSSHQPATVARTVASVPWDISSAWTYLVPVNSPDLSPVLQALVGTTGWTAGNAVNLVFDTTSAGSGSKYKHRRFVAWDRVPDNTNKENVAKLTVVYEP